MWLTKGDRAVLADVVEQSIRQHEEREAGVQPAFLPDLLKKLRDPMEWVEDESHGVVEEGEEEKFLECPSGDVRCPHCGANLRDPDDKGWLEGDGIYEGDCHYCKVGLFAQATSWVVSAVVEKGATPPPPPKED